MTRITKISGIVIFTRVDGFTSVKFAGTAFQVDSHEEGVELALALISRHS